MPNILIKKRREFFLFNNISIPLRKIQWRLKFDFLEKVLLEALCFVLFDENLGNFHLDRCRTAQWILTFTAWDCCLFTSYRAFLGPSSEKQHAAPRFCF
ncbi:hypothetical protein DW121_06620 [Bacteroides sp. AM10-21B]|nr:hypothetical protein DW121_06620 [Bacteroides sp. AM10-21B]